MGIPFSDCVENIVGEEEIARYEQFLLLPQCFQKLSVVDALKEYLWSKRLRYPDLEGHFLFSYFLRTKGNHSHYFGFDW